VSGAASRPHERSAATTPTEAADQTTPEVEPMHNRRLGRWPPHIIGFILFALAIAVVHRELAQYRPADLFDHLAQIPASAIALALIAAALGYGTLTLFDLLALHYLGKRLPYGRTALARTWAAQCRPRPQSEGEVDVEHHAAHCPPLGMPGPRIASGTRMSSS
jgi:hypothetical protein